MKKLLICLFLLIIIVNSGCTAESQVLKSSQESNVLVVYTTVFPVYDFTQKIGGDRVKVYSMLPWGASPHSFEPSTRLLADLTKAGLIICNGAGLEPYMAKLADSLKNTGVTIVDTSQGIELLELNEETGHDEYPGNENNGHHDHGLYDPHIWLSPANAAKQAENILNALVTADPLNKEYYLDNYGEFIKNIKDLDLEYKAAVSRLEKNELVVTHEAFAYLCRDYGLNQISLMGPNAESEPTPGRMREIVEFVRAHNITHIFLEALESPKAAETIASETNTQILTLNPLGGITEKEVLSGEDYFSVMRNNLANLKKGLNYK